MLRTNRPRRGLSLVEVLIAMFVMAIGMIAIFTLFPLGAIKIGQALKDDRCSQSATQADAYMRAYWRDEVVRKLTSPTPGLASGVTERFYGAIQDSESLAGGGTTPAAPSAPPAGGYADTLTPGYPVLIDPLGYESRASTFDQTNVAYTASVSSSGSQVRLVPRRQLLQVTNAPTASSNAVSSLQAAFRIASMSDDLTFSKNGSPVSYDPVSGVAEPMTRQGRYTWAALVQRMVAEPRGMAKLTVLVFDGRPRLPARTPPSGTTLRAYNDELMVSPYASAAMGSRQVTVTVPARGADDPVLVREGGWVFDGTLSTTPASAANPVREAKFYRVVALTEIDVPNPVPGTTTYTLDLDKPLASDLVAGTAGSNLYFFAGLSEVFERNELRPDNNN